MSTDEISMTISDDQLTVTLADSSFTNDSSTDIICSDEPEAGDGCSSQSTDTFSVVTSTAAAPMSTATLLSSRFTVQPAFPPQSVKLNHDYHNNEPDCLDSVAPPSAPPELGEVEVSAFQGREVFFPESETRKKVSFPEGEALIKGFAHAPNPWYNVSHCTTDNLVSSYVNSCAVHSVRPLSKLVSQLNMIQDFTERVNMLSLKGENIGNNKHIESLEEIFRRVQFVNVDMSNTHLDDESAIALFEMVEYYESVIHLKLAYNKNLGLRAWAAAARMIRKTQHLESIDLRGCSLNEQCVATLGRALRMGTYIHVLYLQECSLSSRSIMILSAALKTIPNIKELHIGENNLQPADGIQIGNLIRNNTYLHVLDVRHNNLQNIGIARICDGLAAQSHGVGLKSLNIAHNHFNAAITSGIAAALAVKDYQSQQKLFLREIQSQVSINAEVQRAKLDKLLIQSKPGRNGAALSVSSATPVADGETPASSLGVDFSTTAATTMHTNPASKAAGVYLDPLGAVSAASTIPTADSLANIKLYRGESFTPETVQVSASKGASESTSYHTSPVIPHVDATLNHLRGADNEVPVADNNLQSAGEEVSVADEKAQDADDEIQGADNVQSVDNEVPVADNEVPRADKDIQNADGDVQGADEVSPGAYNEAPVADNIEDVSVADEKVQGADKDIQSADNVGSTDEDVLGTDNLVPGADNVVQSADGEGSVADEKAQGADKDIQSADNVGSTDEDVLGTDNLVPGADNLVPGADNVVPGADNVVQSADEEGSVADEKAQGADNVDLSVDDLTAKDVPASVLDDGPLSSVVECSSNSVTGSKEITAGLEITTDDLPNNQSCSALGYVVDPSGGGDAESSLALLGDSEVSSQLKLHNTNSDLAVNSETAGDVTTNCTLGGDESTNSPVEISLSNSLVYETTQPDNASVLNDDSSSEQEKSRRLILQVGDADTQNVEIDNKNEVHSIETVRDRDRPIDTNTSSLSSPILSKDLNDLISSDSDISICGTEALKKDVFQNDLHSVDIVDPMSSRDYSTEMGDGSTNIASVPSLSTLAKNILASGETEEKEPSCSFE
ncbi:PPP1R37 [Bugula neritina]|uniref:PPP1R37 n=1 Tax=Bugula neritina TaxID=10212 RepID=A0A7J7JXW1_BUGNE|nr:PPP1R37 [Bugula neritina]